MQKNFEKLSELDLKLLAAMQENNRRTGEELADIVGLSATSCQRRLRRLRDTGVIEADVSVVSPKAVGRPLSMIVLVTLERERSDIVDEFKRAIREAPEVMSGYYLTGETDFMLIVTAEDMDAYEAFTRGFFYRNSAIKGFKTLVVMDRVKASMALPL